MFIGLLTNHKKKIMLGGVVFFSFKKNNKKIKILPLSELWENPEEFNPDRFLNDQNHYQNNENLIPFSVGKRFCLGKTLAEQEFFLFLTGQDSLIFLNFFSKM